jgi:hypothetical protein
MMKTKYTLSPRFLVLTGVILIAALFRLLPHWPNFTPVAAIALFGGAHFSRKAIAFMIPLAALFLSDLILGFHGTMWAVYLGFIFTVALGMGIKGKTAVLPVLGTVVASSVLFYLLTNLAAWIGSPFYPQTFSGLMMSYAAGIPFLWNSLAGDLFYSGVLFGSFYFIRQRYPILQEIRIS